MENQHRKITGYRELTEGEIALMNKIKEAGANLDVLCSLVAAHVAQQRESASLDVPGKERGRLDSTEPERWIEIARTDLQRGIMELTRAVAQPTTF